MGRRIVVGIAVALAVLACAPRPSADTPQARPARAGAKVVTLGNAAEDDAVTVAAIRAARSAGCRSIDFRRSGGRAELVTLCERR